MDADEHGMNLRYEQQWHETFASRDHLKNLALKGNLRASAFRSVCWRVFLDILPIDASATKWLDILTENRAFYRAEKRKAYANPYDNRADVDVDNPLSQERDSTWNRFFLDQELLSTIKQDVTRTFPGLDFFRKHQIERMMMDVLFVYARLHPKMCYRQGMHEILAPLLFVLHCDHQAYEHVKQNGYVNVEIERILDGDVLEEDGFTMFTRVMANIDFCYNIKNIEPTQGGHFPVNVHDSAERRNENGAIKRLNFICDKLLRPSDTPLHKYLIERMDIPIHLFGIRWLRLLFGREFSFQELLVLWDAIFAEAHDFDLVNYVFVAMLIAIRQQLLESDYSACLTYLMRYPSTVDTTYIIDYALYLKYPHSYPQPTMANQNRAYYSYDHQTTKEKPTSTKTIADKSIKRSINERLNKLNANNTMSTYPSQSSIMDGFTLSDPEMMRVELEHARSIMSLCQLKLVQYHKMLANIKSDQAELHMIADGLCELSHLLRTRHYIETDVALEADEVKSKSVVPSRLIHQRHNSLPDAQLPRRVERVDRPLKMLSQIIILTELENAPVEDPLHKLKLIRDVPEYSRESLCYAVNILNSQPGVVK